MQVLTQIHDDAFISLYKASSMFNIPYLSLRVAANSGELQAVRINKQVRTTINWIKAWQVYKSQETNLQDIQLIKGLA